MRSETLSPAFLIEAAAFLVAFLVAVNESRGIFLEHR